MKNNNRNYHEVRIPYDSKREILWKTLCSEYFNKLIGRNDTVLELGAGYAHFINHVICKRKIAVDLWDGFVNYTNNDVETKICDITELDFLSNDSLDFVFASNLFEHVSIEKLAEALEVLKPKMKDKSTINLLQPNFKYSYKEYFDDYTHKTIFTDVGLSDFLIAHGFKIVKKYPKFLPLSVKSKFPVSPFLIKLYLISPIKLLGKQMFIQAELQK